MRDNPFENIESAHQYLGLLRDAVNDAEGQVQEDIASLGDDGSRRLKALQLVAYKLSRLDRYLKSSRLTLNDLRSLRKLLFEEREGGLGRRDAEHDLTVASGSTSSP
jgi:hypothetical protein